MTAGRRVSSLCASVRSRFPIRLSGRALLHIGLLFLACAGIIAALALFMPDMKSLAAFADRYFRSDSGLDAILFILLTGLLGCVAVPRQVLAFAGGYVFGCLWGTVLVTLGCMLGCALSFQLARVWGRAAVERRYGLKAERCNMLFSLAPFRTAMILRLIPTGNNLAFSLLAGVSRIPAVPFILGSGVGYLPQNLVFSLLGSGVRVDPLWRTLGSAGLLALSLLLAWRLYRSWRRATGFAPGDFGAATGFKRRTDCSAQAPCAQAQAAERRPPDSRS